MSSYQSMILPEINDEQAKFISQNMLDRICTDEFDDALKRTDPENRTKCILDALTYAWGGVVEMNNLSEVINIQKECYLSARGVNFKHMPNEYKWACIDFNNAIRHALLSRLHPDLKYDINRAMAIFLEESADYNNASEADKYFLYKEKICDVIRVVKRDCSENMTEQVNVLIAESSFPNCNAALKNNEIATSPTRLFFPIVHGVYKNLNDFPLPRNHEIIQEISRTVLNKIKRTRTFDRLEKNISDNVNKKEGFREFFYYNSARAIFNGLLLAWTGKPSLKIDSTTSRILDFIESARADWIKADGVEQIFNEKLKLLLSEQFYVPSFAKELHADYKNLLKVREGYENEVRKIREIFRGKSDERKLVNAAVGKHLTDVIEALNTCGREHANCERIALQLGWKA